MKLLFLFFFSIYEIQDWKLIKDSRVHFQFGIWSCEFQLLLNFHSLFWLASNKESLIQDCRREIIEGKSFLCPQFRRSLNDWEIYMVFSLHCLEQVRLTYMEKKWKNMDWRRLYGFCQSSPSYPFPTSKKFSSWIGSSGRPMFPWKWLSLSWPILTRSWQLIISSWEFIAFWIGVFCALLIHCSFASRIWTTFFLSCSLWCGIRLFVVVVSMVWVVPQSLPGNPSLVHRKY